MDPYTKAINTLRTIKNNLKYGFCNLVLDINDFQKIISSSFNEEIGYLPKNEEMECYLKMTYSSVSKFVQISNEEFAEWFLSNQNLRTISIQNDHFNEETFKKEKPEAIREFEFYRLMSYLNNQFHPIFFTIEADNKMVESIKQAFKLLELKWDFFEMNDQWRIVPKGYNQNTLAKLADVLKGKERAKRKSTKDKQTQT